MDYINKCLEYIDKNLKESRKQHTFGVVETAKQLAAAYNQDVSKAETAALFHDIAKPLSAEESDEEVRKFNIGQEFIGNTNLAHGRIAACWAEKYYGIEDKDILNAIRYHTSARAGMSLLEKIIFVADAVEPGRTYPEAARLRKEAFDDLEGVYEFILKWTVDDLKQKGIDPGRDTIEAYKECFMNSKEMALFAAKTLDAKKGGDVMIIDIAEKSSFADYFVLVTAGSERQLNALVDEMEFVFEKEGIFVKSIEGKPSSGWMLMDYGDIIVNVLTEQMRDKYSIEKIWGDCSTLDF